MCYKMCVFDNIAMLHSLAFALFFPPTADMFCTWINHPGIISGTYCFIINSCETISFFLLLLPSTESLSNLLSKRHASSWSLFSYDSGNTAVTCFVWLLWVCSHSFFTSVRFLWIHLLHPFKHQSHTVNTKIEGLDIKCTALKACRAVNAPFIISAEEPFAPRIFSALPLSPPLIILGSPLSLREASERAVILC